MTLLISTATTPMPTMDDQISRLLRTGSASQKQLADFVLRNPVRAAAASIEDMAKAAGVSAPTVSRFARELGFSGFAELRAAMADALQLAMDPVAKLKERLEAGEGSGSGGALFDAVRDQLGLIDGNSLDIQVMRVVERLRRARSVYVMGFGLSAHVAALLVLGLQPFQPNVTSVVEFGGTEVAAGRLMNIGPEDVLIAITVPRYASDVLQLTQYARDSGALVVGITDSTASPLAPLSDELLLAPCAHPILSSSMVAPVAVAETLVAAMMLSDRNNADKAARLTKAISSYLHRGEH
jgi:DNA-binding MurR/RpiR family transcriptional regulator